MPATKKTKNQKPLWTPARIAFTVSVLSLLAAFGVSSCSSRDEKRPAPPEPRVETKVPPRNVPPAAVITLPPSVTDVDLRSLSGGPIKLSSYAGKVLIINLWATWCGPCRQEIPELNKLYKEFRTQGLEVVGLSTENPDASAAAVRQFVQDYNVDYRIGWASSDVAITLMQGRDAIPQSFVIARSGRIVKRFVGFNVVTTPPQIREAVEEAFKDAAPGS